MNLVPAMGDLLAESEVNSQVWTDLEVVLNEHLRALQASAVLGAFIRLPVVDIPEQKVGVLETGYEYRERRR